MLMTNGGVAVQKKKKSKINKYESASWNSCPTMDAIYFNHENKIELSIF